MVSIKKITKLIRLVEESDISGLEVSSLFGKIKIKKNNPYIINSQTLNLVEDVNPQNLNPVKNIETKVKNEPSPEQDNKYEIIKSPMVGTFYVAPSSEADPYVTVGKNVAKGDPICIIEAMKLMNEIVSEYNGVIRKVYVENKHPVEYGQELFRIEVKD